MKNNILLRIKNLNTFIDSPRGMVRCSENVNFEIFRGDIFGIVGESGSGKTITALSILGLVNEVPGIIKGEIEYFFENGEKINLLEPLNSYVSFKNENGQLIEIKKDIPNFNKNIEKIYEPIRGNHISIIFQDPQTSLNPFWKVGKLFNEVLKKRLHDDLYIKTKAENYELIQQKAESESGNLQYQKELGLCLLKMGKKKEALDLFQKYSSTSSEDDDFLYYSAFILNDKKLMNKVSRLKGINWLKRVWIYSPEVVYDNLYPHSLSGGMCQRIMIALALASHPVLLIADEPTTGLDVTIQVEIIELLKEIKKNYNLSIILISHDLGVVSSLATKIAIMYNGRILEYGNKEDIFTHEVKHLHPYTSGLLNSLPRYETLQMRKSYKLDVIEGEIPDAINPPSGCRFHPRCERYKDSNNEMCVKNEPELFEIEKGHYIRCWKYNNLK